MKKTTKTTDAATSMADTIDMHPVKMAVAQVRLVGDSPLLVHNFNVKSRGQMLASQTKQAWPKEPRDPEFEMECGSYYIEKVANGTYSEIPSKARLSLIAEGRITEFIRLCAEHIELLRAIKNPIFGFPTTGFKKSAVRGAKSIGLVMKDMNAAMFIPGEFVLIDAPVAARGMAEHVVRIGMGQTDLRFRPIWREWAVTLNVVFNASLISASHIFNMFQAAGTGCGVGEWRVERGGSYGMFHVDTVTEKELKQPK